ncbi:hypothetical protein D9M70_396430 [compost metagenome]
MDHAERFLPAFVDHAPHVGQAHALAFADQQRLADLVLELLHHLADGRLGDEQRTRRLREAVQARGLDEIAQRADIDGHVELRLDRGWHGSMNKANSEANIKS